MLARLENDPNIDRPFSTLLPRMSFEISGIEYDGDRKLHTVGRVVVKDTNSNKSKAQYNPVPYDITFSLSIYVKNVEDGTMIVEQILPYFTPEWTTTAQLIENPDITLDIPLILNSVTSDEVYEGSFEERRVVIWTLDFTMKAFFFGPTRRQGVIKLANVNFYDSTIFDDITDSIGIVNAISRIITYPGMTANGEPTTDPESTIDRSMISSTDTFDYIVQVTNPQNEE
jgi:hypothetical protein